MDFAPRGRLVRWRGLPGVLWPCACGALYGLPCGLGARPGDGSTL